MPAQRPLLSIQTPLPDISRERSPSQPVQLTGSGEGGGGLGGILRENCPTTEPLALLSKLSALHCHCKLQGTLGILQE